MKKINLIHALFFLLFTMFIVACSKDSEDTEDATIPASDDTTGDAIIENCEDHDDASDYIWDESSITEIRLQGSSVSIEGSGATASQTTVTINQAGVYRITGTLNDGQILVNSTGTGVVKILLNGVDISCSDNAPFFIMDSEKTVIYLTENTENKLSDAATYNFNNSDEEPNATLFSKSDLTLFGKGSLTIKGNYNDGIGSKDGLIIASGTYIVNATDDGIRGKDYLIIKEGNFTISSQGDGLTSDNESDATKGYISISNGVFSITAANDAIQAETDILVSGGEFSLVSGGGGGSSSYYNTESKKGIKAGVSFIIDDGIFNIDSNDDAIHSNKTMAINGGTFEITSGDDGFHADTELGINAGNINIYKSYEGIESALIRINDGIIHLTSSDDGINVAGGNDGSSMGGRPGQGGFTQTGNYYLYIKGGYIVVNANGDGLDCNGTIEMSGGTVIVNGPTANDNGALDYDRSFTITGGTLVAAGSSRMAQAPSSSSSQNAVLVNFSSTLQAKTLFHIQTSSEEELVTMTPGKYYQSVLYSSPNLKKGTSYNIYTGGAHSGTLENSLYSEGTYTPGAKYSSFTVSNVITTIR